MTGGSGAVGPDIMQLAVLLLTLGAATAAGFAWRLHNGRMSTPQPAPGLTTADIAAVGGAAGSRATLVQFSSSFCSPCRATRQILTDVAHMVDGVSYVEIDAEQHLDVVRRLGIIRTPTTLVLDTDGAVVVRASGQPRKADVIAAVGRAIERSTTPSPNP